MSGCGGEMKRLKKKLKKRWPQVTVCEERGALKLEGEVATWQEYMKLGYLAAKEPYRGVINRLRVIGIKEDLFEQMGRGHIKEDCFKEKEVDVAIIGGGVVGAAIAHALSKWNLQIHLLEKESDLGMHQSSRNDSMVHPGLAPSPGTKKAYYNVRGNALFEKLAKNLDVPFYRPGSLVLFNQPLTFLMKSPFLKRAVQNSVPGVRTLSAKEARQLEPNISTSVKWALHLPTTGVCPPYQMTIALAESSILNGAEVSLETKVYDFEKTANKITKVITTKGVLRPKVVINAAGLYADFIADLAGDQFFTIHPRKGEVLLMDAHTSRLTSHVLSLYNMKNLLAKTKGGGIVPTYEGNLLLGPNAYEQPYREDYSTHERSVEEILRKNQKCLSKLHRKDIITYLAGCRAATFKEDFIVEKSQYVTNLIHCAGIQSPGFASAPALAEDIAKMAVSILEKGMKVVPRADYKEKRKGIPNLRRMDEDQRHELIAKKPAYGEIVCRCEEISKGEILDALRSPLPVYSLDGIKRRTRAGMGRCQGGFCTPFVASIIAEELGQPLEEVTKKGPGSDLLVKALYEGQGIS